MTEQVTIDVNDLLRAKDEMIADANRTIALSAARGFGLERKVKALQERIAELEKVPNSGS